MKNNKYIDKVLDNMIKRTKIDIDEETISLPFLNIPLPIQDMKDILSSLKINWMHFVLPFVKYCNGQFGLTEDEIDYVFRRYIEIIEHKISNGE